MIQVRRGSVYCNRLLLNVKSISNFHFQISIHHLPSFLQFKQDLTTEGETSDGPRDETTGRGHNCAPSGVARVGRNKRGAKTGADNRRDLTGYRGGRATAEAGRAGRSDRARGDDEPGLDHPPAAAMRLSRPVPAVGGETGQARLGAGGGRCAGDSRMHGRTSSP